MAGLPLSKGRPLYLVTKHTKFNYSGKGELCFQHRKVIHMRWTPLLFCFPQCFYYDGPFLSFSGGEVTNTLSLHPVSFCPDVVSVFLFINSQYLSTARPRPNFLFLAFSLYHEELQYYLVAWLRIELLYRSYIQQAECRLPACVFVYILWRMLPKQDMPISVEQPPALGHHCVFFSFQTSANSYLKRMKNASNVTGFARLHALAFVFFFLQRSQNSPELSRANS